MKAKVLSKMAKKNIPAAPRTETEIEARKEHHFTGFQFAGIVLIAAVVFNLPNVVIPPTTTEERMMIVILAGMLIAGAMLLGLPTLLKKIRKK